MERLSPLRRIVNLTRVERPEPPRELTLQERFQEQWQGLCDVDGQHSVVSGQAVVPGVTFWLDEDQGQQKITCYGARGGGLRLQAGVDTAGRWMGLHFGLGDVDFSEVALFGVYSHQRAVRSCTWRMCVRSGTPDGFVDHFFDKHVVAYNAPATHLDTIELTQQNGLPRRPTWRELVLFFHPESFDATIQDLRLFVA